MNKKRTVPSTICRVEKRNNYTVMSNFHLQSKNLSLKAVGLLSKILSLPDDWVFTVSGLVSICKEKETAVKSALKELKKWGYLKVTKMNSDETDSGRYEYVYTFYEYSELDKPENFRGDVKFIEKKKKTEKMKKTTSSKATAEQTCNSDKKLSAVEKFVEKSADKILRNESSLSGGTGKFLFNEEIPPVEILPVENQALQNTNNKINKNNYSLTTESVCHTDIFFNAQQKEKNGRIDFFSVEEREKVRNVVKANVGYEEYMEWIKLFPQFNYPASQIDEFLEMIVREICSTKEYEWICCERVPREEVRKAMLKADRRCLENAVSNMFNCEDEIRNKEKYFISTLYNEVNCKEFTRLSEETGRVCVSDY